ncbi:hypothetical protein BU17DRAFT_69072 [Hysterangium stoloniferum]|nr:hypothetical protein BU17DRAFT_69072 [Hysterangium stoloniferum]
MIRTRKKNQELMSFLTEIKLKAVDGQRQLHGLFGLINIPKEEEKISFLKAELQNRLGKFEATRKHLHDQLVLKNQLQQLHDQAEQSRQLQPPGNAINRIELSDMTLNLQSSMEKEFYYIQIELRQLEVKETAPPIALIRTLRQEAYNSLIGSLDSSEQFKRSGTPESEFGSCYPLVVCTCLFPAKNKAVRLQLQKGSLRTKLRIKYSGIHYSLLEIGVEKRALILQNVATQFGRGAYEDWEG